VADVRFLNELEVCDKVYKIVMPELQEIKENQHASETGLDGVVLDEIYNHKNDLNNFYRLLDKTFGGR